MLEKGFQCFKNHEHPQSLSQCVLLLSNFFGEKVFLMML